jgi:hypothetical protein
MTVAASIDVSGFPTDIEIQSDNTYLYVLNAGQNGVGSNVIKVDLNSFTINATYALDMSPADMTLGALGNTILISGTIPGNPNSAIVQVVKPLQQTVSPRIVISPSAGGGSSYVVLTNDEQYGYVTLGIYIYKIEIATSSLTLFMDFSAFHANNHTSMIRQILIDSSNNFLFAMNNQEGEVLKINLTNKEFSLGEFSSEDITMMKFDPDENFIYVSGRSSLDGSIIKINSKTLKAAKVEYARSTTEYRGFSTLILDPAHNFLYAGFVDEFFKFQITSTEPQSIDFTSISNSYYGNRTVSLAATASSGLPVSFASLTPGTCQVSNETVSYIAVGSCSIKASQSGGFGWDASTDVIRTFEILPQTILFSNISDVLSNEGQITLTASATSGLPIAFTSASPDVCEVQNNSNVLMIKKSGQCRVGADQSGNQFWDAAQQVSRTFSVLPAPPIGEQGISINSGSVYTNTKNVKLNVVWPSFATEMRVSNDGGFISGLTVVKELQSEVSWELDDSIYGLYTKNVYVRFSGNGIDQVRTFSDDIILDTTNPSIQKASSSTSSGSVLADLTTVSSISTFLPTAKKVKSKTKKISMVAKDNKSGVATTQLSFSPAGQVIKTLPYRKSFKVKMPKATKYVYVRVLDGAGNPSPWKRIKV